MKIQWTILGLVAGCVPGWGASTIDVRANLFELFNGNPNLSADLPLGRSWSLGPTVKYVTGSRHAGGATELSGVGVGMQASVHFAGVRETESVILSPYFRVTPSWLRHEAAAQSFSASPVLYEAGLALAYGFAWHNGMRFRTGGGVGYLFPSKLEMISANGAKSTVEVPTLLGAGWIPHVEATIGYSF